MRHAGARAIGLRRHRSVKYAWLCALTALGMLALSAAAQADATWTGASTSAEWSASANWSGTTPPTTSNTAAGTLAFPTLGACGTCYTSHNGLTGITSTGLVLANSAKQYRILGNRFTVGVGGIADTPGGGTGDVVNAPIALSGGSQTWVVGSTLNGYNSLTLLGAITGTSADAVAISMPRGDLFLDSDMEAGPVTSKGPGGLHIGGAPGTNRPGSVNGGNGEPVTVTGGSLVANPDSTTGPLTMTAGTLLLGTGSKNTGATTLHVNGAATLGSSLTTKTFIDDNGSTAGTAFSQLSAGGDIALGGRLILGQGPSDGQCVALTGGDVATLVTTTGTLSGTFSNAAQGATLTMASSCESTPPTLQIHYTANSVTATVLGGAPTPTSTTLATPSPSPATTNATVTLTATVTTGTTGTVAPAGAVAFSADGAAIPNCTSQPVTASGSSGTATCSTSFAAGGSPLSLTAAFTPSSGSGQAASTSLAQTLTVNRAGTATALSASDASPTPGESVTYTTTVTPAVVGAAKPSGTVAFLDGGSSVSGCTAQPLTAGSPSSTATCTVSYPSPGSHTITATYAGDANFTGSSSPATTVTVQATTTAFPTTPVLDTFSQPGPLSGNWQSPALQDSGTVTVSATPGQTMSGGGTASANWVTTRFNADQEAYLSVPVLPAAGHSFQVDARISTLARSSVSMYFLQVTPSKQLWDLRRKLNGAASTSLRAFTAPFAAGDSAGLQLSGSTITAWHQPAGGGWAPIGAASDTSITSGGYIGFTLGDPTIRGGAFGGGDSVTGQGSTPSTGTGSSVAARIRTRGSVRGVVQLRLSHVSQSRIRWQERHAHRTVAPAHRTRSAPVGTRFAFSVSAPTRVSFSFIQVRPGRRVEHRCIAPTRATHRARACHRTVLRGRLARSVSAGRHQLSFDGRVGRTTLPSGSYSVVVTVAGTGVARARTHRLRFTIVR